MAEQNVLASLSTQLADVVEKVGPSVVRVDDGSRLTASGVIWTAEGIVIATSHGVEQDEGVMVQLADGRRLPATVAGRDPDTDLAALRVEATGLPAIERASPDTVQIGHLALALGRPGSSGLQATIGIIGARMETESEGRVGYVLHTDAVLYPGFSGGPLVDTNGQVVGINNLMYGHGRGVSIGLPIVEPVIEALLSHGRVQHGYLGIRSQSVMLPDALRTSVELEQQSAVLIVQVDTGTPAEKAGLILGDVLVAINGRVLTDVDDLRAQLRTLGAGQTVTLRVIRAGAAQELQATLGAQS